MRHWAIFPGVVANYRLLPGFLATPAAFALPLFEAVLAASLLLQLRSPWPAAAAAALLTVFAAAIGVNILRGRQGIDCGCFQSALKQTLSWTLVIRNLVLALLSCLTVWLSDAGSPDLRATMEGLLVGGVLFMTLRSLDILWSIVPAWRRPRRLDSGAAP